MTGDYQQFELLVDVAGHAALFGAQSQPDSSLVDVRSSDLKSQKPAQDTPAAAFLVFAVSH